MALAQSCRAFSAQAFRHRLLHTTAVNAFPPRENRVVETPIPFGMEDVNMSTANDDTTSAGHQVLQQRRHLLYYLRLIEHEVPNLVAYRKTFVPPGELQPLVVRTMSYGGEEHPAMLKRTIVVPVARLPLKNEAAIHKFKLLAGVRWSSEIPRDAGISADEGGGTHGYVKISCEDFPKPAMNLKWASDALDSMIVEANNSRDTFADVPLDTRHIDAKVRKAKKGDHVRGRRGIRPTLKDFPKEWLPVAQTNLSPTAR